MISFLVASCKMMYFFFFLLAISGNLVKIDRSVNSLETECDGTDFFLSLPTVMSKIFLSAFISKICVMRKIFHVSFFSDKKPFFGQKRVH